MSFLEAGVITASKLDSVGVRLLELGSDLTDWLHSLRDRNPGATFIGGIEAGYVDVHARESGAPTALVLAEARGVVSFVFSRVFGIEARRYVPATVKKAACGYGKAEKDQVARMVKIRLGLRRALGPDAADALAIALTRAQDTTTTKGSR